jgi:hypothetical protein
MTRHPPARRAFLTGAIAAPVVALPASSLDPVKDAAAKLTAAMVARHGGKWSMQIDHETGFVLIRAHHELPSSA